MTRKRAERLTGYQIFELPPERGLVTVGAFEGAKLIVKALGRAEWIALKTLVDRVYMLHSRIVFQTHGYRAPAAGPEGSCRFIIENIARTVGRIASIIWNRSAGIAIESHSSARLERSR